MKLRWVRGLFLFSLVFSLGFAALVESGDSGEQFAKDMIEEQCSKQNVKAVYHCFGNVVKAVSSNDEEGSTFYKPNGAVVRCPPMAPTDMGAECLQMMTPNYCTQNASCGESEERIFPGQNPEQNVSEQTYKTEEHVDPVVQTTNNKNEIDATKAMPAYFEFALGNLTIVLLLLTVASMGVLFALFKKTIEEDMNQ